MVTQQRRKENRATSTMSEAMSRPQEMVKEYPVSSILVVFGVGLGVGVLLSQAILPAMHEPTMSERMGRQLYDSMGSLSSAVQRGLHLS